MTEIQKYLFDNQDLKYRDFSSKLIVNVGKENIIGVRAPVLKAKAKQIYSDGTYKEFISHLPHKYLEENSLHGYILCRIKNYDELIREIERFLPYVDNWAVCDTLRPVTFKKHTDELFSKIKIWISSDRIYTKRFAIGMLLSFYLDEKYKKEYLDLVADADSGEYYISMMVAWYFATALFKHYDDAVKFIEEKRLLKDTHNRTIQKSVDSYRITNSQKEHLRKFRIKK